MRGFLIAFLGGMLIAATTALAQSKMSIGGVDTRIPPLESQYIAQETAQAIQQAARAAAMLTVAKADADEAAKAAKAAADFWKAWCGERPGCATPAK